VAAGNLSAVATSIGLLTVLVFGFAALLAWANRRWPTKSSALVEALNDALPQTQCAQCGYPGCRPYAQAMAEGQASVDLCPPGGAKTQQQLANLMGVQPNIPLVAAPTLLAKIDEVACIGCALCLPACPVDAILGAKDYLHTVIDQECTGCELCIAPCPVDCIVMYEASAAHV